MKLAEYVINYLQSQGIDTAFLLTGGMAMHLNDALARADGMNVVCCQHEQACSLAAEGYTHVTGKPALVQVTAGPGVINALTGVFGAFVDGLPMVIVSGQCKRELLCASWGLNGSLRQVGEQEADAVALARPITKYAVSVQDATHIRYELEKALHMATTGRPGPVWLEIPLDVQAASIEPETLRSFRRALVPPPDLSGIATDVAQRIREAKRPAFVIGPGVRLEHAEAQFVALAEKMSCPVLCAGTLDVIQRDHPLYIGAIGNVGSRAGNINIQNADLLIFLGVTMHVTFTTYDWQALGRNAWKLVVEVDAAELERPQFLADQAVLCGITPFLAALDRETNDVRVAHEWLEFARERVRQLPQVPAHLRTVTSDGAINPYYFADILFDCLGDEDIVAPGNASAGVTTQQAGHLRPGQRLFANFGNGPMGFAVPAAIGAAMAGGGRRIICLDGDGSFMLNMQELATIMAHQLPIIIFIYNNNGYLSIKLSQKNFFEKAIGAGPESGLFFPDFVALARAFGMEACRLAGPDFRGQLVEILKKRGPLLVDVRLDSRQGFEPKIAARLLPDGRMVSSPPEDMFPFMSRDELARHLLFRREEE